MRKILYTLLMSVFFVACSEEADFSVNPSLRLTFSCDTLMFDTLFTEVGSPTAAMKVYNRNSSSLHIGSVGLVSGGTSGFRMNVDGQYATVVRDVDIRKNDSLYLFVEVTPDKNSGDLPVLISDSIQFTLESGVQQYVALLAYGRDVEFMRGVVYDADSRLVKGHYVIYDSLVVATNATLTIEAGAILYFHKDAELIVRGTVKAMGETGSPVVMRGDRTDNMFDYLPYDRIPGQWGGVRIDSTSNGNLFIHCDIHSAEYGILVQRGDTSVQRLTIESSRIENFDGNALETHMAHVDVTNSLIANSRGNCVKVIGGNVDFRHCTIANFYVWKQRDVALALYNSYEGEPAPLNNAFFANCIITGSRSDELMGYFSDWDDTIPNSVNYLFESSLINTVEDEDNPNFINVVYDRKENSCYAKDNFRLVDNEEFRYDFHLSDSSAACGIASDKYSSVIRYDLDGLERALQPSDAGCFIYQPIPSKE